MNPPPLAVDRHIVHISTSDIGGGAARAAYHLLQGLRELGQDCSMLVKGKISNDDAVREAVLDRSSSARKREREIHRILKDCVERNRTSISNTLFSLPAPGYDLSRHEQIQHADIIHLHWVAGLLSPPGIAMLQRLGKPIVWTLHDQRAFTGGCHFSAGCQGFETNCKACPQLSLAGFALAEISLQESLQSISRNLVVVCPSRWLADCARRSALLREARIEVIPYGINTSVFKPGRVAARKRLGLEAQDVYLLAGADAPSEHRKGFMILAEAMRLCTEDSAFREAALSKRIHFLFFGSSKPLAGMEGLPVRWLGRFASDAALAEFYAACDAFLLPSTEDNLPNTMLESICSGTPVIGSDIGGLRDAIESGRNGLLVPGGNAAALARAIRDFALNPEIRRRLRGNCTPEAATRFTLQEQARRHLALYEELLASPQPLGPAGPPVIAQPLTPLSGPFARLCPALRQQVRQHRRNRFWHRFRRFFLARSTG